MVVTEWTEGATDLLHGCLQGQIYNFTSTHTASIFDTHYHQRPSTHLYFTSDKCVGIRFFIVADYAQCHFASVAFTLQQNVYVLRSSLSPAALVEAGIFSLTLIYLYLHHKLCLTHTLETVSI